MSKVIFFDIDGTLFDHQNFEVTPSARVGVNQARENGNTCFVASGRAPYAIVMLDDLSLDGMIFSNGAGAIYHGKLIVKHTIPSTIVRYMIDLCTKYHVGCILQTQQEGFLNSIAKDLFEDYVRKTKGDLEEKMKWLGSKKLEDYQNEEVFKIDVHFSYQTDIPAFIEKIPQELNFVHMISTQDNDRDGGEITYQGVNKGNTIKEVVAYLNREMKDTMAFGDSFNDVEMLQIVETGIAMGNAVDRLKEVADDVTNRIDEDGIYNALKKYQII